MSPSHGVAPWAATPLDLEPQRQHPLCLDPDLQIGRLAGDREVADEAAVDEVVAAAFGLLLGLLVADDPEPHPHPVLVAHRRRRHQHRRQRTLHVVGAAPVEPVAVDPRVELARPPGDHVEMAVQHDRRRILGPDLGLQHRQAADLLAAAPRSPAPRASP